MLQALKTWWTSRPHNRENKVAPATAAKPRSVLQAVVHRACRNCGAPGVYKARDTGFDQWPRVCVLANSELEGQPVGARCPQCGRARPESEDKGVIWTRY